MSNYAVTTVPVGGFAPLGIRISAGTVMAKFGVFCKEPALESSKANNAILYALITFSNVYC